jgi:transcriptional regulator with PAS, ATPase and Fis domain
MMAIPFPTTPPIDSPPIVEIGGSPEFRAFQDLLKRAGRSGRTVLIQGETGAGKELAARSLHTHGPTAKGPFIAINCATLSENLLESELFGHERGAFTGAVALKRGKFELACGGTVFLDELGELPPALQSKLLRVLQQREFERVGGVHTLKLNARILAATNRDLLDDVQTGLFRADLYYRLKVLSLRVPALRERKEDIVKLAIHFLCRSAEVSGRRPTISPLTRAAESALREYSWPGNVRELENAMEYADVMADDDSPIDLSHLPLEITAPPRAAGREEEDYRGVVRHQRVETIRKALHDCGGKYPNAARQLGVHVKSLHRMAREFGLK